MPSINSVESFEGTGTWEECDSFIRSIREAAWKESKIWDNAWMAGLASLHFSRRARLWYSQLPEDVRKDWSKLETTLVKRWAPSEDDNSAAVEPIPAAAPSQSRGSQAILPARGIVKAVCQSNTEYYFQFSDNENRFQLTTAANDACRFLCSPLLSFAVLEPVGQSRHSCLAVHRFIGSEMEKGTSDYAYLTCLYSDNLKSSASYAGQAQLMRCTVSANRELTIFWAREDGSTIPLSPFVRKPYVWLVADANAYCRTRPDQTRAKLFIEPIDQA